MKTEFVVLILWLIAIVTTVVLIDDFGAFTYLGPVYLICMIGSVVVIRREKPKVG